MSVQSPQSSLEAAEAIRGHHVELHANLRDRVLAVRDAVRGGGSAIAARDAVLAFLDAELLPHAMAEEKALYPAGAVGASALLVEAMIEEHRDIVRRIGDLRVAVDPVEIVAISSAVLALFESHLAKENDRLIPALVARDDISLGDLLAGMHELVG
jgi:iron-sulfur cluster repair protein YtfE (RIC family)